MEESLSRKGSGTGRSGRLGLEAGSSQRIEGYIIINRNQAWVKRYAKVENQVFSYKKDKKDHGNRLSVDLRQARIRYSNTQGGSTGEGFDNFIQISSGTESLALAFENVLEFESWKRCFVSAQKQPKVTQDSMMNLNAAIINHSQSSRDKDDPWFSGS